MTKPRQTEPLQADPRTPEETHRSRNRVLGLGLAAFVILVFFISIAKMG